MSAEELYINTPPKEVISLRGITPFGLLRHVMCAECNRCQSSGGNPHYHWCSQYMAVSTDPCVGCGRGADTISSEGHHPECRLSVIDSVPNGTKITNGQDSGQ